LGYCERYRVLGIVSLLLVATLFAPPLEAGDTRYLDCRFEPLQGNRGGDLAPIAYRFMVSLRLTRAFRIGAGTARRVQMRVLPDRTLVLSDAGAGAWAWLLSLQQNGGALLSRHDLRAGAGKSPAARLRHYVGRCSEERESA
jgi:hypothetical protein